MDFDEIPLTFVVRGAQLVGVASVPAQPARQGVLIVVGGPQYRAGSHRQFVLLARHLAAAGIAAMRFDYRGMGDSEGQRRAFHSIDDDIKCAIDAFMAALPSLEKIALWGLCDAATAASFYAPQDPRVSGLILVNPWIRSDVGAAKTYLRHYYFRRLFEMDFWRKTLSGKLGLVTAGSAFVGTVRAAFGKPAGAATHAKKSAPQQGLPEQMYDALSRFQGRLLIVLSGNDLTAREFALLVQKSPHWQTLLKLRDAAWKELPGANHTFARDDWRGQVSSWTSEWLDPRAPLT